MLLTIHNLPSNCRYSDVKSLLEEKCGLTELILDHLVSEGTTKKVTVGVADEGDAAILVRKINGLYINGLQLYVEDKRKKRDLDQPYRSTASMLEEAQYQEAMVNPPQVVEGGMMVNPLMLNYNMMGMYMPTQTMDQSIPYVAYGVPQVMPSAEFVPGAPVANERGFQGEGTRQGRREGPQDRPWDGPQGRREGPQDRPWDGPQGRREEPQDRPWDGPQGRGRDGPQDRPQGRREGPQDRPQGRREGPQDRPWDGPQGRGRDGPQGRGRDGPQGRGRDGPQGRGWDVPLGRGRDGPQDRPRDGPQDREAFRNRDRNRRPSPERPETFNRPRRDEEPAPRFPRREQSPRQSRGPPEMNLGPRAPFRQPGPGPRDPKQFQSRQPEPEFRRTDPQWESRASRWDPEPEPRARPEPGQEWPNAGPVQNFEPEPDRPWDRPNRPDEGYRPPDRFEPNQPRFEDTYRPDHFRDEPEFREPAFHDGAPEFQRHAPELIGRGPDIEMLDRHEPGYNNDRERRPRQPDAWNKGSDNRDRNAPNDWRSRGNRHEEPPIRPERPPRPSPPNFEKGNERRVDGQRNPKRPQSEFSRGPDKWNEIANDYPAPKKPRGLLPEPRHKPPMPETRNIRPPFKPGPRPAAPIVKQFTMKNLINKDQTARGQATAVLSKEIIPALDMAEPGNKILLKEVKSCIRGRIDVLLGEQLSSNCEDVVKMYRAKYSKQKDREFYKALREKVFAELKSKEQNKPAAKDPKVKQEGSEIKQEPVVKEESVTEETNEPGQSAAVKIQELDSKLNAITKKAPNRPLTDKQIISAQKRQSKLEFSKEDLFKLDPIMDKVLDEELNKLNDILRSECENSGDEIDTKICNLISTKSAEELKKVLRLHITKRILNITSGLPVRIFSEGKLPRKTAIKEYLLKYRIERLTLKKNKKGTMFIANLSNYAEYDKLCRTEHVMIDGVPVIFRSMNLLGPPMKMSKSQIQKRRKELKASHMDLGDFEDDLVDFGDDLVDAEDFTADPDMDDVEFKEEDLEDF